MNARKHPIMYLRVTTLECKSIYLKIKKARKSNKA